LRTHARSNAGFFLVALAMFAVLLPACANDDGGGAGATPTQDPAALEGHEWVLDGFRGTDGQDVSPEVSVNATFDGSTISGSSGCNQYNASYEAAGDQISFGPIAGTLMACPEPAASTEQQYLALLDGVATYAVDGSSLTMFDADGTSVLRYTSG
jgi:heat shock protein HslJ